MTVGENVACRCGSTHPKLEDSTREIMRGLELLCFLRAVGGLAGLEEIQAFGSEWWYEKARGSGQLSAGDGSGDFCLTNSPRNGSNHCGGIRSTDSGIETASFEWTIIVGDSRNWRGFCLDGPPWCELIRQRGGCGFAVFGGRSADSRRDTGSGWRSSVPTRRHIEPCQPHRPSRRCKCADHPDTANPRARPGR